jgi:hypothetical protein
MSASKIIAQKIVDTAAKYGWKVIVRGSILTITKTGIDSKDAFVRADMEYYSVLGILPSTSPGSIWGTDGGGIGALTAMKSGVFTMNKSGGSTRVLNALKKIVA